jgi:hypothetical protein
VDYLPATANHCCFSLSSAHVAGQKFGETAADLVARQLLPIVTTDIVDYAFFEEPEIIHLWPAEKNAQYLQFMMDAAKKSGLFAGTARIQTGGNKFADGFKLRLK